MHIERISVAELRHPEKNTRVHNNKQIDELVRSLNMFGQIRPAVVDEENVVWCGNGMLEAACRAGWSEIDVYRVVGLTDAQKKKLMLADNQTFLLGATNTAVMDEILTELQDFDVPGFDEETLCQLYGDLEEAVEELQTYGVIEQDAVRSIERAEATRATVQEERVFTPAETEAAPYANAERDNTTDDTLPRTISATEGVVNIPRDTKTRPFIVCPKCGEKIYV